MASETSENTIFIRFQFTQPQDTLSTIHRPYLKQDRARKESCPSKIKQQIIRMLRKIVVYVTQTRWCDLFCVNVLFCGRHLRYSDVDFKRLLTAYLRSTLKFHFPFC